MEKNMENETGATIYSLGFRVLPDEEISMFSSLAFQSPPSYKS